MSNVPEIDTERAWALLDRFTAGELSADEAADFSAWMAQAPEAAEVVAALRGVRVVGEGDAIAFDLDAVRDRVRTQIMAEASEAATRAASGPALHRPRMRLSRLPQLRATPSWIAATVVAVLLCVGLGVTTLRRGISQGAREDVTTYMTMKGQRANIVLSDGSRVLLNVASRIDVPRHFGEHNRVIRLQGQAYFSVTHTTGAPFIVDAGGTRTTVLGTEFGIRAYQPGDVQVAVWTGKVTVNNMVLGAHDIAQYFGTDTMLVTRHQSLDAAFAFTAGRLVIANRPLRDVLPDLNRWFAADIRLGDRAIGDMRFDAVLGSGSVGDLVEVLTNTLDVRIVREGHTLTLFRR